MEERPFRKLLRLCGNCESAGLALNPPLQMRDAPEMIGKKWRLEASLVSAFVHGALLPMIYDGSAIRAFVASHPASLLTLEGIDRQLAS